MNGDMEFSFEMSNKEIERIKNILTSGGLRHYLLEIADDEELDVVEYKEYQKLEKENQELEKQLEEERNKVREYSYKLSNFRCEETYENQQKEFIDYMENKIYSIEPKGTGINYNCEYDSEEDFISAMEEQSRLNTLKEILSKFKEIIGGKDE